jgi:hypothetical protein
MTDAYRVSALAFERVFLAVQGHLLEAADIRDRDPGDPRDDRAPPSGASTTGTAPPAVSFCPSTIPGDRSLRTSP